MLLIESAMADFGHFHAEQKGDQRQAGDRHFALLAHLRRPTAANFRRSLPNFFRRGHPVALAARSSGFAPSACCTHHIS